MKTQRWFKWTQESHVLIAFTHIFCLQKNVHQSISKENGLDIKTNAKSFANLILKSGKTLLRCFNIRCLSSQQHYPINSEITILTGKRNMNKQTKTNKIKCVLFTQ